MRRLEKVGNYYGFVFGIIFFLVSIGFIVLMCFMKVDPSLYEKANNGQIVDIVVESYVDGDGDTIYDYYPYVSYDRVDGTHCDRAMYDTYTNGMKVGDFVDVYYLIEPEVDEIVKGSLSISPVFYIAAGAFALLGALIIIVDFKKIKKAKEVSKVVQAQSKPTIQDMLMEEQEISEFKKYYFQPKNLWHASYKLYDRNKKVLYEVNRKKTHLFAACLDEHINHVSGKHSEHKIGKTISTGTENMTMASYFYYDGENVLDYLQLNGIDIHIDLNKIIRPTYNVTYKGKPIATIRTVGKDVFKDNPVVAVQGCFQVDMAIEFLDIMIVVLLACNRIHPQTFII